MRLVASLAAPSAPDGLEDMLAFYLNAELDTSQAARRLPGGVGSGHDADMIAWINDGQQVYYPVLISSTEGQERVILGVAALSLSVQREPTLPPAVLSKIARLLREGGELQGIRAAL